MHTLSISFAAIVLVVVAIVVTANYHQHAVAGSAVEAGLEVGDFPLENEAFGVDWGMGDADLCCLKKWGKTRLISTPC